MDFTHLGSLSVIVPCRDTERFLGEALDSILTQSVFSQTMRGQFPGAREVIVVDDGSTDGSAALACSYGGVVRCISQAPAGIAAARNSGIRAASGQLLAFLDADDLWPRESLAHRLAILADNPAIGCAYGGVETFFDPGSTPDPTVYLPPARPARLAGAMLVRRAVFEQVGEFDTSLRVGETLDWAARLDDRRIQARATEQIVLRRRVHASNTVRQGADRQSDYLKVVRAALNRRRGGTA